MSDTHPILADRVLLDMIERLESTRATLEATSAPEAVHALILADNTLRSVVEYLVRLREERLGL